MLRTKQESLSVNPLVNNAQAFAQYLRENNLMPPLNANQQDQSAETLAHQHEQLMVAQQYLQQALIAAVDSLQAPPVAQPRQATDTSKLPIIGDTPMPNAPPLTSQTTEAKLPPLMDSSSAK